MDLKELGFFDPKKHWYYKHKAIMLKTFYKRFKKKTDTLIDIGAGSGFFCETFSNEFNFKKSICVDPFYSKDQVGTHDGLKFQKLIPNFSGDLYLLIDVLEHVIEPELLLKQVKKYANQDSLFIMSVPAFHFLWSNHDVYLEHVKRYSLAEIENIIKDCGFKILYSRYIFAPIFPLVYLKRKLLKSSHVRSDMRAFGKITSFVITLLLSLEKGIRYNSWFGTSAIVFAEIERKI